MGRLSGRVLTASTMQAHNTFDQPDAVQPANFADFQVTDGGFTVKLPSKSVVMLRLE
jgi:alpha-N-arabinofuranosidase